MKTKILALSAIALLGGAPVCNALTWYWSFNGGPFGGTGTFLTSDVGPAYLVTGVSGTTGGLPITGLVAPGGFASNDNQLFFTYPQLTVGGISFATSSFVANLSLNPATGAYRIALDDGRSNAVGFGATPDNLRVAEPGTLALLGLGLAGLSLTLRRKTA
jgi:hypothetical protein